MKNVFIMLVAGTMLVSCAKERIADDNSASSQTTSSSSSSSTRVDDKSVTPPAAVLNAFTAQFGNVTVTQWKLRSDGTYRAHFMRNGIAWEATFTASGTLVKSEAAK